MSSGTTQPILPSVETTIPDLLNGMDYSACVGMYQKPGCGTKPVLSGDRGGPMQLAVFGILIAGMAFIGVRIARSVIARDRERDSAAGIKP
ncbi:MAG: hypothetical protein WCI10_01595 [Actinomycetota bacterium]